LSRNWTIFAGLAVSAYKTLVPYVGVAERTDAVG
jgi:hypothetical protein